MGEAEDGSLIKKVLKTLCSSHGCSYGVFWSFDHRNSVILTMKDIYYVEQVSSVADDLLLQVHILGEGIVGEAALTGKHRWIFADMLQDNYSEFHSQFSQGIKTIVVIPIERQGVVEFGFNNKILEQFEILDETRRLISETFDGVIIPHNNAPNSSNSEICDINGLFASLVSSTNCSMPLPLISGIEDKMTGPLTHDGATHLFSNYLQISTGEMFPESFGIGQCNNFSVDCYLENDIASKITKFTGADAFSQCFDSSITALNTGFSTGDDVFCHMPMIDPVVSMQYSVIDISHTDGQLEKSTITHFAGNDSFDCLGPDFGFEQVEKCWEDIMMPEENSGGYTALPPSTPRKRLFTELGLEELLNSINNPNSSAKSCIEDESLYSKRTKGSTYVDGGKNLTQPLFMLERANSFLEKKDIDNIRMPNLSQHKRAEEPEKVNRKRARCSESDRPRPKDRQQIQDRIKELRGIIPDGGKCSIDSLLDRTVKYMMFLQSVKKHAINLKLSDDQKLFSREKGFTWAFEVGLESAMACPITVEDLTSPGQMLIEMLCEEDELFLEIADLIRGLGLNILKGVMEMEGSKIWSRFVVEANRHITRLEVFWSLVQLLNKTTRSDIDSINKPYNVNDTIQKETFLGPVSLAEIQG